MLVTMPHVNEDMKSAEECGVHWRPIPNRQCPDYRPRPPVYEYPPPQWPSYEHPSQHHPSTYEHPPHHRPGYEHPSQYHPSNYVHPPPQRLDYEHHPPPAWTEWPHHPPPSFAYYHRSPPPPQSRYPVEQFVYHSSTVPPLPLPLPPSPPPPPPLRPPPVNLVYEVGDSDVLCGRGAPVSYHPGNQYFRSIVGSFQPAYLGSKRADKPEVACLVVERIRERGGRFLKRTKLPGIGVCGHFCWIDIGEQRAYEKACQALREGAPEIRRQLAENELSSSVIDDSREDSSARSDELNERDGA